MERPSLEDVYLRLTSHDTPEHMMERSTHEPPQPTGPGGVISPCWHQVRYEQLSFRRNPQAAFFTFVFPVVLITIFGARSGSVGSEFLLLRVSALQYYVPTIAAVSVLGSCYSQLAIVLAMRRQNGILKRVRATPLPAWAYFLGLLAHCIMVSAVDVALITGLRPRLRRAAAHPLGSDRGGAGARSGQLLRPGCRGGLADPQRRGRYRRWCSSSCSRCCSSPAPTRRSTPPLLNRISGALPVRPFNQALLGPFAHNTGLDGDTSPSLAAWGAAGALIAIGRFRWNPRPQ